MARASRSSQVVAELLRLGIVLLTVAAGYTIGGAVDGLLDLDAQENTRLVASVLGALVGYLLGGVVGRAVVRGVDTATQRFERIPAVQLVAAAIGAAIGGFLGVSLLLPVLLLPYQRFTVPVTLLVVLALAYAGARVGGSRGAELGRFVGMRGRLEVRTPARGAGVKVVDSSALIDGRIVDVARAGFLEGTLVVPMFVLEEVQGIADSGRPQRRQLGRRGLGTLRVLQDEGLVGVEVDDDEVVGVAEVDAKLTQLCRRRQAALVTGDANLAGVAEVAGIRVLNVHALADAVRSPVVPGDQLRLLLVKPGRDAGQAVGYLPDGTMVVVDGAAEAVGREMDVDVTSIVQSRQGRLLFAVAAQEATV